MECYCCCVPSRAQVRGIHPPRLNGLPTGAWDPLFWVYIISSLPQSSTFLPSSPYRAGEFLQKRKEKALETNKLLCEVAWCQEKNKMARTKNRCY